MDQPHGKSRFFNNLALVSLPCTHTCVVSLPSGFSWLPRHGHVLCAATYCCVFLAIKNRGRHATATTTAIRRRTTCSLRPSSRCSTSPSRPRSVVHHRWAFSSYSSFRTWGSHGAFEFACGGSYTLLAATYRIGGLCVCGTTPEVCGGFVDACFPPCSVLALVH